jgi:hypothetical protein
MNLAVNGLRGEIKQANTYYEDPFTAASAPSTTCSPIRRSTSTT